MPAIKNEHPIVACYRGLDSADAVWLGALLAGALDEPLVLVSAYRYEPLGLSARVAPNPGNARRAADAQAALRYARAFAGTDIEVREQSVPSAGITGSLAALARDVDACVLVLGRDTEGHITRSLVPRAPCPIAVAPTKAPGPQAGRFKRIGVAYDDSPTARLALLAAKRLALATGARLVLLSAGKRDDRATTWRQDVRLAIGHRVPFETHALAGDPAATLTEASRDLDLLVCGSRGRSRPVGAILGSVSAHLIAHAQIPVLVVPPVVGRSDSRPLGLASAVVAA